MPITSTNAIITDVNYMTRFDIDIPSDPFDLESLIMSMSSSMEAITNRKLRSRSYDYTKSSDYEDAIGDGDGTAWFTCRQYPVSSITTLIVSDVTVSEATDWDDSDGYFLYKSQGRIYYEKGFPKYRKNVKLKYTAGYADSDPEMDDLKFICGYLVALVWKNRDKMGLRSEAIGRYRYTMNE